ncbi:type I polyketide synthase [Streptomyces rugosispiralis]|uniref:SDR family NAD(P)-dependent oxidoreductase n=1 Tax=Streptomyces rugosispiralis TaxID=2967341 RepID=A0ABT1VBH1_9ACTN|nr:type I polyketide synthase [Streptomyces rugosispiralis]MCQ8193861.1 SDR family NAD(P)-dependent oxidoreductase [Streptomyces rugosispiralis]
MTEASDSGEPLIAVTALDCRFPGAPDTEAFWELLVTARHGLTRHSERELADRGVPRRLRTHPAYVPVGGVIHDQDQFDPAPFGIGDFEAALMDPQQRLFLEACWRALERAGHGGGTGAGAVGVFAGSAHSDYLMRNLAHRYKAAATDPVGSLQTAMATVPDYLPLHVAHRLGLTGPAVAVGSTCSTSLVAVHLAVQSLLSGECDTALAGGVSLIVPQGLGYLHVPDGIFSADGRVRTFSADGTGIVHTQGVGVAVLRRLDDALADGDPVLAVVCGSAVNNDGADKTAFTAPSPRGQARVVSEALHVAGLEPRQVSYVEAHGTATRLGDLVELTALRRVFGQKGPAWCALGSVKSNIGHANSAAGIAGFAKTVLALHHGVLPASLDATPLNPDLELDDSPFSVVDRTTEWPGSRYAGVSSFGMGGTNCHVVLGSAPPRPATEPDPRPQLMLLSAHGDDALASTVAQTADALRTAGGLPVADASFTLHTGRMPLPHRAVAVVRGNPSDDGRALRTAQHRTAAAPVPRIVLAFPGGGAPYPGMGRELLADEPVFARTVEECAALFDGGGSPPLTGLLLADRDDEEAVRLVRDPAYGFPALFTVSLATARVLHAWGLRPDAVVGHSVGEYAAAVVAGALSTADAAALVKVRSRGMSRTAGGGAMLTVPLAEKEVTALLAAHPELDLAAVNAPESCVVSGPEAAVAAVEAWLAAEGVRVARVRLAAAAHSRLVDPALPELRAAASGVDARAPRVPLVSTLTGRHLEGPPGVDHWVSHLRSPIRFSDALTALLTDGPTVLVQTGPGSGLLQFARGHRAPNLVATLATFPGQEDTGGERAALLAAAGELWTRGAPLDAEGLHRPGRRRVILPGHPFARRRLWVDPPAPQAVPDPAEAGGPDEDEPFHVPSWRRAPALDDAPSLEGRWLVDGPGNHPVGDAVRTALASAGATPVSAADVAADPTVPCAGVIVLDLSDTGGAPADRVADGVLRHAEVARLTAGWADRACLLHVSRAAQQVESADRPDPGGAAATAVPRVLAQEFPGLRWRALDLPAEEEPATCGRAVCEEAADLSYGGRNGLETALRGGHRWIRSLAPWQPRLPKGRDGAAPGTAVLIGGLGDVGLAMAGHLAEAGWRVVVTGRTGLAPDPAPGSREAERAAAVARLRDHGLPVEVRAVDAADRATTVALLREVAERHGGVDLVVHGAGVVASAEVAPLRSVGPEVVRTHARAKVEGAEALRAALEELPERRRPATVLLMSSATAVVGGLGIAPYAAANRYLDALAERLAREDGRTRWISVAWDAWRIGPGGGERTVVARHSIGLRDGMRSVDRLLALAAGGRAPAWVAVSPADLNARTSGAPAREQRPRRDGASREEADGGNAPRSGPEETLAGLWSELLGFPVHDRNADFFALGGHSLLATRMLARLRDEHGVALRLQDLLSRPTVAALAELLPDEGTPVPLPRLAGTGTDTARGAERGADGPREFPLTRVQHAYWVGGSGGYRLGDVPCSFHLEHDCTGLDMARYEDAWNRVIARHPMLRAVVTPEGRNRVLDRVPRYRVRVRDLSGLDEEARADKLARIREAMVNREPRPGRWPLVDIRAARLPGGVIRLFLNVDVLVCDTASFLVWNGELRTLYEDPGARLPAIGTTFADCVAALEERGRGRAWERAAAYWRARLDTLPDAPGLPVRRPEPDAPDAPTTRPRFTRRAVRLEPDQWQVLKAEAARRGLTPTAVLLAAYADALAAWSGQGRFAITLTLFDRPEVHRDVDLVVGDFTSLMLHEVDRTRPGSFADDAAQAQRTLFRDLDHREFSALDLLAEKSAGEGHTASVPVVFTSALGLDGPLAGGHDLDWAGTPVYGASSTPQTWLDHQVIEQHGALLLQWDVLESVLPAEEADRAFTGYVAAVRRLATGPPAWDTARDPRPATPRLPAAAMVREDPGETALLLRDGDGGRPLFLMHPSGGDVLCYGDIARLLADGRRLVALTDPALTGGTGPADIPAMADRYLSAVRAYQPHGPYLLGGWSMGGTVAHEMARALERRGERTDLLVMIDSNTPDRIRPLGGADPREDTAIAALRYLHSLEAFLDLALVPELGLGLGPDGGTDLLGLSHDEIRATVTERMRRAGLVGARDTADTRLAVFERHLRALGDHRAGYLSDPDTRLLLVRASQPSPRNAAVGMGVDDASDLPALGWRPHMAGPVEEAVVEGHHYSLLTGNAVKTTVSLLDRALAALPSR